MVVTPAQQASIDKYKKSVENRTGMSYQEYIDQKKAMNVPSPYERDLAALEASGTGDLDYEREQLMLAYQQPGPLKDAQDAFYANSPIHTNTGQRIYNDQADFDAAQRLSQDPTSGVAPLTQEQIDASAATGVNVNGATGTTPPTNDTTTNPPNNGNNSPGGSTSPVNDARADTIAANQDRINNPTLPEGTTFNPVGQTVQPNEVLQGTLLDGQSPQVQNTTVQAPEAQQAATMQAAQIGNNVPEAQAAQGTITNDSQMQASQIDQGVGQVNAVTGDNVQQVDAAQIEDGTGQAEAAQGQLSQDAYAQAAQGVEDAQKVALLEAYQTEIDNMAVDPRATVQEQYNQLMDFEAGDVPTWAQGALNTANAEMARRGLTNTTVAGNATFTSIVQAAMPIAQQDAKVFQTMQLAQMEQKQAAVFLRAGQLAELNRTNVQNRQSAALQKAQAALTMDMANLDNEQQTAIFNAQAALQAATVNTGYQQQAAMENARNALAMDLTNLSAENQAAIVNAQNALSIESQNLNARQQAAQFNANAFLQMDLTNVSNEQQAAIINAQGRLQALMSDQAANNAAAQFNAASENQVTQFFAQMANSTAIFNATQALTTEQFNAEMQNQRDQFNSKLATEIEQSNVIYQRQINTQFTADQNQANLINAQNLLGISNQAIADNLTLMRDDAHYAFTASENAQERATRLAQQKMINDTNLLLFDKNAAFQDAQGTGDLIGGLAAQFGSSLIGSIFGGGNATGGTTPNYNVPSYLQDGSGGGFS